MENNKDQEIKEIVTEVLKDNDLDLIECKIFFSGGVTNIRCLVDHPKGGVNLDECVRVNAKISAYLEETQILGDNYTVEIDSPGVDRKLTTQKDFARIEGKYVMVWLREPINGKEYFEGEVLKVEDNILCLKHKDGVLEINFSYIKVGKERVEL